MGKEAVLRGSLVCLGAAVCLVGICTFSFKKMVATYVFGILAVCGIVLPDWEFFDRDFSQWLSPMPADRPPAAAAAAAPNRAARNKDHMMLYESRDVGLNMQSNCDRFKFYPLRVALFVIIYSFGFYKWWSFVSS